MNSGMQGPDGLFNDGLDLCTCQNNGAVGPSGHADIAHAHRHITDRVDLQPSPSISP